MEIDAIDHVNLKIPADGIEAAIEFYHDGLRFDIENRELYEAGEKPFVSVRLNDSAVIHLRPSEAFVPPEKDSYDHLAIVTPEPIDAVKHRLETAKIEIDQELEPLGATGVAPAVYVTDPFGYFIEIKTTVNA
ncbi:VOC family protein [Halalkalirubrum salinum]|uniref:VOC family protein n=1 Tax=Halalkalirubrum salinum TaxID=2563889 RepID=UPI0010FB6E6E|nr:VOC family protein [Halalkalirubrum salinum]